MFEQAKSTRSCIIFTTRSERPWAVTWLRNGWWFTLIRREQTLKPVSWWRSDGFENSNEALSFVRGDTVPDCGNPALLRPRRFRPSGGGRSPDIRPRADSEMHMRKVPLGDDVMPANIARGTPGFFRCEIWPTWSNSSSLFARSFCKPSVEDDKNSVIARTI